MRRSVGILSGLLLLTVAAVGSSAPAKKPAAASKRYVRATPVGVGSPSARIAPSDAVSVQALLVGAKEVGAGDNAPAAPAAGPDSYLLFHAEFDTPASCQAAAEALPAKGAYAFNRFDRWADFFVKPDEEAKKAVLTSPGLFWVEIGRRLDVPPPPREVKGTSRSNPEAIVRGGISGLTGKGVLVAVIDSGIDFRHPDFITKDASGKPVSRIQYLWDTLGSHEPGKPGGKAPVSFPNGSSLGTLYTGEQLTAELQSGGTAIPAQDTNGHGTSCAGIAAGNGSALPDKRYLGVAPAADLIGVRIGPGPGLPNADMIGAVLTWLDEVAGSRPLVVSCSFGGQYAGRDGNRILERQINARFSPDRKGRALCIAAGNEGADPLHAEVSFGSAPGVLTWKAPASARTTLLDLYFDGPSTAIRVDVPLGSKLDPKTGKGYIYRVTKQLVWTISVPAGAGELRLTSTDGTPRKVDAYIKALGSADRAEFTGSCLSFGKQIGTPGTIPNAITVGSYDWNNVFEAARGQLVLGDVVRTSSDGKPAPITIGNLSSYSNPGYSRMEGVIKPEIVAPGQFHTAPCPNLPGKLLDASGRYQAFNGTSAATPYVSGVLALVLQKKPQITLGEIRDLLRTSASRDSYTGSVPNPRWGHGKLNLAAVQKLIGEL